MCFSACVLVRQCVSVCVSVSVCVLVLVCVCVCVGAREAQPSGARPFTRARL